MTGCYAQRAPEELAAMAGVAAVVGNSHKALAPQIILGLSGRGADTASANRTVAGAEDATATQMVGVEALLEQRHGGQDSNLGR